MKRTVYRVTQTGTFGPFSGDYEGRDRAMPDMGRNYFWARTRNAGKGTWQLMGRRRGFPAMEMGCKVEIVEVW